MKVLLVNHGRAGEWGGGDGVQIRETAKRLNQRGHEVTLVNSDRPDARGYDIVHLFNCRIQDSFEQQMASCQAAQVPVVVSPIWVSIGRALWGSRGTLGILQQALEFLEQQGSITTYTQRCPSRGRPRRMLHLQPTARNEAEKLMSPWHSWLDSHRLVLS